MNRPDLQSARTYNEQSMEAYEAAGDNEGMRICSHNGISIAVEMGDVDAAISMSCDAIRFGALSRDMMNVISSFHALWELAIPLLQERPEIIYPLGDLTYEKLMGLIADTAKAPALGKLIGATFTLMASFGLGGTPPLVE